jgi:3-deoxy-D-manno-octulosonic-acid transferase
LSHFQERLGFLPHAFKQAVPGAIWLHAVSVGEVLSAVELLRRLRAQLPSAPLFVSTTTLAGRRLADQKLKDLSDGVFHAPLDYCFAVRRVLRTMRPSVVVVAETEIWPNLFREAKRFGCGLAVVNGRISDSAEPRYRRFAWFFQRVLRWPDAILAQSDVSRQRFVALGAPAERVTDAGNIKYDVQFSEAGIPDEIRAFVDRTLPEEIWIAASTMPPLDANDVDEDDAVIDAFRWLGQAHPGLLLILAPRKPERFGAVGEKLRASNVPFVLRSKLGSGEQLARLPGVLLLDTIGELSGLFALEAVVFMGGSLARRGGHNILEPAFFARPVVTGPHMENFSEIIADFREGGACLEIAAPRELAPAIDLLLWDPEQCSRLGERARRLTEAKRGAADRATAVILGLHSRAMPRHRPPVPLCQFLRMLSWLWRLGAGWKRRWDSARSQRLSTPVASVGSLGMGGSGKTPFVLWLAQKLKEAGHQPAILTRGYRRRAPEKLTVAEAGARLPVARTGDEAQILLRAGVAPVGIGADRAASGRAVEERFHPGMLILDDGFQHWRLERDLDIVLVDGLDPFAGGEVFPFGRLREPPLALARADLFVITRAERGRSYAGIEAELQARNPRAPVFEARVVPECWIDHDSGQRFSPGDLPFSRVAAFCGLANPASFRRTLTTLGIRPAAWWEMSDHHRYRPVELRRLAAQARNLGAEALLTTEKDAMNLCDHVGKLIAPLRLCWLKIGLEVEGEERLLQIVEKLLGRTRLERQ